MLAERIGEELEVPVFLYGELTAEGPDPWRTRAELRRGGVQGLAARMAGQDGRPPLRPDFGPARLHPSAGATLVAAREPLVAFNLQLGSRRHARAGAVDRRLDTRGWRSRDAGSAGDRRGARRRCGAGLDERRAPARGPAREHRRGRARDRRRSPPRSSSVSRRHAALEGFPDDLPMPGFDPARHLIENALG